MSLLAGALHTVPEILRGDDGTENKDVYLLFVSAVSPRGKINCWGFFFNSHEFYSSCNFINHFIGLLFIAPVFLHLLTFAVSF